MPASTADAPHTPDRMPTESEEQAAEESEARLEASGEEAEAAAHIEEMARKGAEQKGEGRIE